jgi:tRNA A58 N-methylase Trm61
MELQNAAELAQLSQSVDHVFLVGDLPEAAETLATMRHCLSAGGEVLYSPSLLLM